MNSKVNLIYITVQNLQSHLSNVLVSVNYTKGLLEHLLQLLLFISYQRQWTSMNVWPAEEELFRSSMSCRTVTESQPSVSCSQVQRSTVRNQTSLRGQYTSRRRINVETQNLKNQNKRNKHITNIMNELDHLFYTQWNYVCLNLPCIFANQLKQNISDTDMISCSGQMREASDQKTARTKKAMK